MENGKENKTGYRVEQDSIGEKDIPGDVYYGAQSLRAAENFRITGLNMHPEIINSLAYIKKASAITNCESGILEKKKAKAIVQACDEILTGKLHEYFIVDPIQGGAGTSLNMNANEVIANRAIEILGGKKGDYSAINPNDDVNCGQSTNDVIPTAGKMTSLRLLQNLKKELLRLHGALCKKAEEFDHVIGLDRLRAIHLNDSKNPLGSHKDRHACIGQGAIGLEALVRVIRHPALKDLPFCLETPNDLSGYAGEIALLRQAAEN